MAERFTRRIDEAFVQRLKFLQKELQRTLEVTRSRQELHHLATAMVGFRRALDPLLRAAAIPALPEEVRAHLRGRVEKLAAGVQSSLEGSAREFRSGGEHVLAIVRQNRVDVRPPVAQPAPSSGTDPLPPAGVAQRRRILI
ncbi:MAG: hypothetical protein HZB56_22755 [Deltaproteobacteria bacterium]|nr:hypothetical protein [Deltaproteobacteria bacterium]